MPNNPQMTQMNADEIFKENNLRKSAQSADRDHEIYAIIGAAMAVHRELVFNLRESAKSVDKKS